jgi:hypothetical protein
MNACFAAVIRIVDGNPYVAVPAAITRRFGKRGNIPVRVRLRGLTHSHYEKIATLSERALRRTGYLAADGSFRANLMPTGKGGHVLYLNGWMRNAASADVGDRVSVACETDENPFTQRMPPLFRKALAKDKKAKNAWDARPPSFRKEVLRYFNFLRSPEALERNVKRMIARLRRGKRIY